MKKILIGLFAMSVVSFSTLTPTDNAQDQSNLWKTGQEGRISLKGKLVTTPSDVKYVIFTSPDGTLNKAEDTLVLPKIILSQNYNIPTMKGTPQKIYVKKLLNNGTINDLTNEITTFRLAVDQAYSSITSVQMKDINSMAILPLTVFLNSSTLQELANIAYPDATPSVNTYGEISAVFNGVTKTYRTPRLIKAIQSTLGVLEFYTIDSKSFGYSDSMTAEQAAPFETQFKGTEKSGEVTVKVKVDIPTTVTP